MKILHVITGLRAIAGTSVFVGEIARRQVWAGNCVTIVHQEVWRRDNYLLDHRIEFVSKDDFIRTLDERAYDIVHIHCMWQYMLHYFVQLCMKKGWPVIWSPHGSLMPTAFRTKLWKKLPVWWLWQCRDLMSANCFHATSDSEKKAISALKLKRDCVVVPLGVDLNSLHDFNSQNRNRILQYIGRISPGKGLEDLIHAFALVAKEFPIWNLRLVGPDQEGLLKKLKLLVRELKIGGRVDFVAPKYGQELREEYTEADLFVLPSHSENFGSVVIESLSAGVPVICTKGAPWQELEEYNCGWWPDVGVEPIREALETAMSLTSEERREMGLRGRKLVENRYTWSAVASKIEAAYSEIVDKVAQHE